MERSPDDLLVIDCGDVGGHNVVDFNADGAEVDDGNFHIDNVDNDNNGNGNFSDGVDDGKSDGGKNGGQGRNGGCGIVAGMNDISGNRVEEESGTEWVPEISSVGTIGGRTSCHGIDVGCGIGICHGIGVGIDVGGGIDVGRDDISCSSGTEEESDTE